MRILLLILLLSLTGSRALSYSTDDSQGNPPSAADGRQIAARTMTDEVANQEGSAGSDAMAPLKEDLARDGKRFDSELSEHADRFKAFAAGEGSRFTSEL